jgi:hypothetical protein
MSEEVKNEIIKAWNKYLTTRKRQYQYNEASSAQAEEYLRLFKEGIIKHQKLSKKEKKELLEYIEFSKLS